MVEMDRARQLKVLRGLRSLYPAWIDVKESCLKNPEYAFDLAYLEGHGLVEVRKDANLSAPSPGRLTAVMRHARITAAGCDFLEQDGGLSAILGVVTIRLDDETIKTLIEARITSSDLPQPEKTRLTAGLRSLPADATKHLVVKLIDTALDRMPDAIRLLQTSLRTLPGG